MVNINNLTLYVFQVTDKLQALNDEFAAKTKEKKELEDQIDQCVQKLDRAEKLIGNNKRRNTESIYLVNIETKHCLGRSI